MKIMSINAGSSSLKFCLFDMRDESVIVKGQFERIGIEGSSFTIKFKDEKIVQELDIPDHVAAVDTLLNKLISLEIIKSFSEIDAVGHRIVQGKDLFNESVIINDDVMTKLESIKNFAPLHNPANMMGIMAFKKVLPDATMVAVFDTAYHHTLEEEAYLYPVPYKWYKDYGLRKYGAHGISHQYIASQVSSLLGRTNYRLISCHIGNCASISSIKYVVCIDTSMGFTPLGGVMMGTRSGDVDPSIIPYIMEQEGMNAMEVIDQLNTQSGLLGLSEFSSDMRDIVSNAALGNHKCEIAMEKYVRRIVDFIAQYYVLLGGADIIVFTAGVGENNVKIRGEICDKLKCLGIIIDSALNEKVGEVVKLSTDESKVDVYVIPTNEELMIARDTLKLINR